MKKFMVLYHGPSDAQQNKSQNPEDKKKGMEAWNTWAKGLGNNLVDPGSPLPSGQGFSNSGNLSGFKSDVTGYSFIQAESLERAQALLKNHPYLQNDQYSIELREAADMSADWSNQGQGQRSESGTRDRNDQDVRNERNDRDERSDRNERDVRNEAGNRSDRNDENRNEDNNRRREDDNNENRNTNR